MFGDVYLYGLLLSVVFFCFPVSSLAVRPGAKTYRVSIISTTPTTHCSKVMHLIFYVNLTNVFLVPKL